MGSERFTGAIAEHKIRTAIAGVTVVALGALGVANCSGDKEQRQEFDGPSQEEITGYCEAPAISVGDYKATIGNNAAQPLESLEGNDLPAIRTEAAKKIAVNNVGLAVASVLIDNQKQPVNFSGLNERMNTTLDVISSDEGKRQEVCEDVVSDFVREGDRVELNGPEFVVAQPLYNGDNLNTKAVDFSGEENVSKNVNTVKGFWIETPEGGFSAGWTADGQIIVPKTVGNADGNTNIDNVSEPEVSFTDEQGNEVTVTTLPNGDVVTEVTNPTTGEVTRTVGPAEGATSTGGAAGPNGTNPEAGPNGVTPSPANGPGPGAGTTPAGPGPGAGTTPRPTTPRPTPTQPPVTSPPVTQPPVTQPPVTSPPVTHPPTTQPPVTTTTPKGTVPECQPNPPFVFC